MDPSNPESAASFDDLDAALHGIDLAEQYVVLSFSLFYFYLLQTEC